MDRVLVKGLAKRVIAQQAPHEEEAFDSLADYYLDGHGRTKSASGGDAPLGAGLATAVPYLIPASLYICERVLDLSVEEVLKESGQGVLRVLRSRKKRTAASEPESALALGGAAATGEDDVLGKVRELLRGHEDEIRPAALTAGIAYGLSRDLAEGFADVIIAEILTEGPSSDSAHAEEPQVDPQADDRDQQVDQ